MDVSVNELVKTLFKEKTVATLTRYKDGKLFYAFNIGTDVYEFAIDTLEEVKAIRVGAHLPDTLFMKSTDLGTTAFNMAVKASELTRWIKKAALTSELIKVPCFS